MLLTSVFLLADYDSQKAAGPCPGPSFNTPETLAVGNTPGFVVQADFNQDGNADLAVTNGSPDVDASILLGDGTGKFSRAPNLPGWVGPDALALGDFNNDGKPDLAANGMGGITIFSSNGNGTFSVLQTIPMAGGELVSSDFNNDNLMDLATLAPNTNTIAVYLGTGSRLGPGKNISLARPTIGLEVIDVNGDGKLDMVSSNIVLTGDGAGNFTPTYDLSRPDFSELLKAGDFNGDGKADVVAKALAGGGDVVVFFGNGAGSFPTKVTISNLYPKRILVGDFNMPPDNPVKNSLSLPADGVAGLVDAWLALHPSMPHPPSFCIADQTYGDPHCCDFVWLSEDLVPRLRALTYQIETRASDHQPVLVELAEAP